MDSKDSLSILFSACARAFLRFFCTWTSYRIKGHGCVLHLTSFRNAGHTRKMYLPLSIPSCQLCLSFLEMKRPVLWLCRRWPQAFSAAVNLLQYFGVSVLILGAWWWIMGLNIKVLCCLFSWYITPFCVPLYFSQCRWIIVLAKHSSKIILWVTSIMLLIFIKFFPFSFDYF